MSQTEQKERYWALRTKLQEIHGPSTLFESPGDQSPEKWTYNTEWRYLQTSRRGRARLFLRDEVILSYLLLVDTQII